MDVAWSCCGPRNDERVCDPSADVVQSAALCSIVRADNLIGGRHDNAQSVYYQAKFLLAQPCFGLGNRLKSDICTPDTTMMLWERDKYRGNEVLTRALRKPAKKARRIAFDGFAGPVIPRRNLAEQNKLSRT